MKAQYAIPRVKEPRVSWMHYVTSFEAEKNKLLGSPRTPADKSAYFDNNS